MSSESAWAARALLEQELDQFDASLVAVRVEIATPDAVHGIVIVASGVFDRTTMGGDAGQSQVDGRVLRSALQRAMR